MIMRIMPLYFALLMTLPLASKSIWKEKNLYGTDAALKPGSVIVIDVNDLSNLRFNLNLVNKTNSNISSNPDAAITGFLPKVTASKKIVNDEVTNFTGKGQIAFSIATRVLNRINELYSIAGSKTYSVGGVVTIITVTGLVDSKMIRGNSILSSKVVDFSMEIRGIKEGIAIQRPPLKKDEKANIDLTEEEKQRIISDYLQKMIRELTK